MNFAIPGVRVPASIQQRDNAPLMDASQVEHVGQMVCLYNAITKPMNNLPEVTDRFCKMAQATVDREKFQAKSEYWVREKDDLFTFPIRSNYSIDDYDNADIRLDQLFRKLLNIPEGSADKASVIEAFVHALTSSSSSSPQFQAIMKAADAYPLPVSNHSIIAQNEYEQKFNEMVSG